jgi:hypothetical protein
VVLERDPANEEAAELAAEARRALARQQAAARRAEREETVADAPPPEATGAAEEPSAAPAEEAGPISPARLEIVAQVAGEGRVMVRDGQRNVATFNYEHFERRGMLRRQRPVTETARAPSVVSLSPGIHTLDFWVMPANEQAVHQQIRGVFRPGSTHTLRIVQHASGEVTARLE